MKKKIACIFNYAPHYRSYIYTLMDRHLGCDFYFGANLDKKQTIKKMDVTTLKGFKRESKVYFFRYRWQCGYPWYALNEYDTFILTGDASISNLLFVSLCKMLNKKVFLWGHGIKTDSAMKSLPLRYLFHNVNGFFLYGNFGKSMMMKCGIPEQKLFVIYNSLNYEAQLKLRNSATYSEIYRDHFHNNLPVVIFSGRLSPVKNLQMILESQRIANASGAPFNVVFVGDGPEKESLQNASRTIANGECAWFFGECYDEKMLSELIYNADLCVSPGNAGLTAIHSLTYGTPVVTHGDMSIQMPESEAIIENMSGDFFQKDNVPDLLAKMQNWFYKSPEERERIRQNCYRLIDERYNPNYQLNVFCRALKVHPQSKIEKLGA